MCKVQTGLGSGATGKPCCTWVGAWVHGGVYLLGGFINDVIVMHDIQWAQYYYASLTNMTFQKMACFVNLRDGNPLDFRGEDIYSSYTSYSKIGVLILLQDWFKLST